MMKPDEKPVTTRKAAGHILIAVLVIWLSASRLSQRETPSNQTAAQRLRLRRILNSHRLRARRLNPCCAVRPISCASMLR